ncbi:glycosyltransferase [Bacillus licheniformis]|nr:glycosyltransferase [Bacillus licheniformis]
MSAVFEQKTTRFCSGLPLIARNRAYLFKRCSQVTVRCADRWKKSRCSRCKDDILFLGVVEDIPALMQAFDVFVMPSLFEGLPLVLVEAQASGLPCIVSDNITEETDLGLGLLQRLSLNAGLNGGLRISAVLLSRKACMAGNREKPC